MTNRPINYIPDLIIQHYTRVGDNVVIIDTVNNEVIFRNFKGCDNLPVSLNQQEIEVAVLCSSKIHLEEIVEVLGITKENLNAVFKQLYSKFPHLKTSSKKYLSNIISENFPFKIRCEILNKYNLAEISLTRGGLKYDETVDEKIKEKYKNYRTQIRYECLRTRFGVEPDEVYLSELYIEIMALLSAGVEVKTIKNLLPETKSQLDKIMDDNSYHSGRLARRFSVRNKWLATEIALKNNIITDEIILKVLSKYKIKNCNPQRFQKYLKKA